MDTTTKLFIGGVSWDTTDEAFKTFFGQFGETSEAVIMRTAEGKSRGFGFVTFEERASLDKVLAAGELVLDGRKIDPKPAVPRGSRTLQQRRQPPQQQTAAPQNTKKIFVGGLSPETTNDQFREYFGQFGEVAEAIVMTDRITNRSRGFGFVTFGGEEMVDKLMEVAEHKIAGKTVECKRAIPKQESNRGYGYQNNNGYYRDNNRGGYNNYRGGYEQRYQRGNGYGYQQQQGYQQQGFQQQGYQQGAYQQGAYQQGAYPQGAYQQGAYQQQQGYQQQQLYSPQGGYTANQYQQQFQQQAAAAQQAQQQGYSGYQQEGSAQGEFAAEGYPAQTGAASLAYQQQQFQQPGAAYGQQYRVQAQAVSPSQGQAQATTPTSGL